MTESHGATRLDRLREVSLDEELLNIIANQVWWSPYPIALAMGIIAYMMYTHIPEQPWIWGGWIALILLNQAYRLVRLPQLPKNRHVPVAMRKREAAILNIVGIGIQSLSLLAFPIFTPFEASVLTIMFVGMGVGSIVTAVGWAPYTLSHVCLTLLPLYGLWLWNGLFGSFGTVGTLVAIVGFAYSFTILMISKRLYRMHEDLFASRNALAEALDKAEAAGMAKTRFLASSSHDLRQPIHALSLLSSALEMQQLNTRTREISANIESAVDALSSELDGLLDISKLDAGVVPVAITEVDLSSIVLRLCRDAEADAIANGITMNVQCPSRAIAQTDPVLFERVIRNVLNNAITHNQHCNLYVNLQQEQDQWHLTISDTGKGIAVEEQERVFEEFYQVHNPERDRRKGLGLGLSIVQRLSALLELGMDFESVPNAGTMFTFCIPAVSAPPSTLQSDDDPPIDLKPMHVLVVDDESAVRKSMTILLESMGHQVSIAEGTESAISLAPTLPSQPDIALIDYRLRGSDSGLITIGRLRELYPRLPAIFISGDTAPDRLRDAEQAGIQLLAKPVRKTELCAAMASADCS